jgi:hypothetical protein
MPYIRRQFIHNGEVTAPKLEANAFDGAIVANTTPVAPSGTSAPVMPLVVILNTPDASGDTTYVLPFKCRIVGVAVQKINAATGAFTHTVTLKNGANAVTNASSFTSNARGHTNYVSVIDDTYSTFNAGVSATLTVVKGAGGNAEFAVVVTLVRVA